MHQDIETPDPETPPRRMTTLGILIVTLIVGGVVYGLVGGL